jgi:two-component system chemotaxis response regulator CheY
VAKKIFIVDDADFIVDMLKLIVQDAGYEVVGTALDGVRALDSIGKLDKASVPDVVTVDLHMPKMDGMETIGKIRALVPEVKIILVSSHATFPVVMQAKSAGVDAFIAKPFEPRTVVDTIQKLT